MLLLVAAGTAGVHLWGLVHRPFAAHSGEATVIVAPGTDARTILESLEAAGVVDSALVARAYLVYVLGSPALKAGEYRFEGPLTVPQVLDRLARGEVETHPVTVVEGLDRFEIAALLAERGFGRREVFLEETASPDRVADLDPEADDLEGYLHPDTYRFARGTSEREIVDTLVATFRQRFEEWLAPALAASPVHGVRQLVTLASIVEKEAARDDERAMIAGVYANRLRIRMPLQADPTVIYALKLAGRWDGNLRRPDLRYASPYNTYVVAGLPPGPICSPGIASLEAAARPADVPYLYFVSRNDGSHAFARTLAEHNRNVEEWQKRYWRERWARERAAASEN